jgi:hypothetical protein
MDRVGEMFGCEELGNPLISLVVGQQGTEQGLLRLDVGGGKALGKAEKRRVDGVHAGSLTHPGTPRIRLPACCIVDNGEEVGASCRSARRRERFG